MIGVKVSQEESDLQKAQVAIGKVWLEHQRAQTQRDLIADPWRTYDNFRINSQDLRKVQVSNGQESSTVHLQYHSSNKFSVYKVDELHNTREDILLNAEVQVNPENNDELLIRTDEQQFKLPFLVSSDGTVDFFDQEGQPHLYHVESEKS